MHDDVIRKPLDTDILQARIKAVQSRYQPQRKKEVRTYIFGKFKFDLQKQILSIEGKTTKLTTKEADLLTLLCQHANNMVDRMHALQIIWRSDNYFSARSMDVYITKLRKLLQDDPTIKIINVHGKGYKLSTREMTTEHFILFLIVMAAIAAIVFHSPLFRRSRLWNVVR